MMMQPATMQSRAEPTRSPWYSPMLIWFIQQVDAPPPALHTHTDNTHTHSLAVNSPDTVLCFDLGPHCHWQLYCHLHEPRPSLSFTLSDTETLSLAEPPFLLSVAQDGSCIFKDGALVSFATEN